MHVKGGVIQTLKIENQANLWNILRVWCSGMHKYILFLFGTVLMKDKQSRFFSGKIDLLPLLTFLQWKKPCSELFSGINVLFVKRLSKFL